RTKGILPLVSKSTRVIDLGGRFVIPGFNDAHIHLVGGGFALSRIDLRGASSLEDLRARIESGASRLAPCAWVQGRGWDQTLLPVSEWPPLTLLDEATGGRPALLYRIDGHTDWLKSGGLKAAGIGRDTVKTLRAARREGHPRAGSSE